MSTARPEADTEYSRDPQGSRGVSGGSGGASGGHAHLIRIGVLASGLLGAALLLIAEFTPLLEVHSTATGHVVKTVSTGAHHTYAQIPVALLAGALAYGFWQTHNRQALIAIGALGLVALLIALLGDLPDAQASGLVGSATTHFATATSTPRIGLYLETLGAVILLISAAAGLLLLPSATPDSATPSQPRAPRTRSAS
jgi:hypothetical protein